MTTASSPSAFGPVLRVSDLPAGPVPVLIEPGEDARAAIAEALGLIELKKLRLEGTLAPLGRRDWELSARLGASVVQPCVLTLAPVPARIEEDVARRWLADWAEPEGEEVESPEDADAEPLGASIDLGAVLVEALALALPPYPRAEGAELGQLNVTEPGKEALTDESAKPFAGLAALRDKLSGDET